MITNVSIRVKNQGLLDFFYPDYKRLHEFSMFAEGGVIFDGDSKYLQMFRDNGVNYIYIVGTPEYDLTIAENLIRFVYSKWDKEPTKKVLEYISELDYDRESDAVLIEDVAKTVWVSGKTFFDLEKNNTMNGLVYKLPRVSKQEIITSYLESINISDYYTNSINTVIRFLHNVGRKDLEDSKISPGYREALVSFKKRRGKNVRPALYNYLYSNIDNEDLKILKLLTEIVEAS